MQQRLDTVRGPGAPAGSLRKAIGEGTASVSGEASGLKRLWELRQC